MKKAMGFIQSGSFKKISTIIGIIGVIIGVILGIYQISQEISKAKETQKEIQIQLSIGDSFSERKEYSSAIKEYEKALSFDKDNIEVHRRIITASRRKFELQLTSLTKYPFGVESQEVDDTLARVYRVYTLNSSSKEDVGLLLEEALRLMKDFNYSKNIWLS
jgi:tetratricopeptide (TPR) repeat protein